MIIVYYYKKELIKYNKFKISTDKITECSIILLIIINIFKIQIKINLKKLKIINILNFKILLKRQKYQNFDFM